MRTLFPDLNFEVVEADPPSRLRERRHQCKHFVRKVKGRGYQLRFWIHPCPPERWYSINAGCYATEEQAVTAGRAIVKAMATTVRPLTPLKYWLAMRPLIALGILPARLLPMWVFCRRDGRSCRYGARVKVRGVKIITKLFDIPEKAHQVLADRLREFLGAGKTAAVVEKKDLAFWWRKASTERRTG